MSHSICSQYHKTVLSLFTMLLPTLDPTDHRFLTSARSACSVCIAYKRLNQQKTLSYTMISLHSCFVAGLTLMYCLWRNRSLFGYEALEATQACSQSLTIFGEKWAGAVKYRDIFDALSGSLFKTLVNPGGQPSGSSMGFSMMQDMTPPTNHQQQPSMNPQASHHHEHAAVNQTHNGYVDDSYAQSREDEPMSKLVSDAVKEAFMEVDEEAPGGWQGWKMWNEMLGGAPVSPQPTQAGRERREDFTYSGNEGWDYVDPLQKNNAQGQGFGPLDETLLWHR